MDNIKKKIENIFEAPIPDTELPSTHYLNDDRAFRKASANVQPLLNQIHTYIKNMSFSEITFEGSGEMQVVILPAALRTLMSKMYLADSEYHKPLDVYGTGRRTLNATEKKIYNKIAHFNLSTVNVSANEPLQTNVSRLYVFKGVDGTDSTSYIYMKGGSTGSRSHFPNEGINKGLKGLGQKLYRALIEKNGWMQTNSGGTGIKDLMWDSLTDFKYKPDGSRDTANEVYSFRFNDALYALSTTIPTNKILEYGYQIMNMISNKSVLATKELRKSNNIAIDPDFIAFVKAQLPSLTGAMKTKMTDLVDWVEPDPARAAERERLRQQQEAERVERENQALAARNSQIADRLQAFCGVTRVEELATDWQLGDWIVLKSYLVSLDPTEYNQLKVRKVVKKEGTNYTALKNTDLPAFTENGTLNDSRNCSEANRSTWVKALPPAVGKDVPPGIMGVPVRARREAATVTAPATAATRRGAATAEPVAEPTATAANMSNIQSLFSDPAGKETMLTFDNPDRKRFLRSIQNEFIYITRNVPADCKIEDNPIFGYFVTGERIKTMFNTKTMESVRITPTDWTIIQPALRKYKRTQLTDKRTLTAGDLVFIKQHSRFFGYVAKVLSTSLTNRGDKYVYLRVPGAGANNRLTLTPIALDQLALVTNESPEYASMFGKVFENYLEDVKPINEANFTFKTTKPTGRYRSFDTEYHEVKLGGKVVGTIDPKAPFKIRLKVMKTETLTNDNPNCKWLWITLKKESESLDAAKEFLNSVKATLMSKYTLATD